MKICRFLNYDLESQIVSIAKSSASKEEFEQQNLSFLQIDRDRVYLNPEKKELNLSPDDLEALKSCSDFDVLEINPLGTVYSVYSEASSDNFILVTESCNSNCIMCPSPEFSRRNGMVYSLDQLLKIAAHIPSDAKHLTITGGEPFMMRKSIFELFRYLKDKFNRTSFLLLTNGRIFSIPEYSKKLQETLPENALIGIPVHGPNEKIHDFITQTPGSFRQTMAGIHNLLIEDLSVEIRIVVSRLNMDHLEDIADLILEKLPGISCVKMIGLEMTGNAAVNSEKVWIPYRLAFEKAKPAIIKLIQGGVDTALYNFPLCSVDPGFWSICLESITDYKVRYPDKCSECVVKDSCGGIFGGTLRFAKDEVKPIEGG